MNGDIKVCEQHQERVTPLIWTFVFPGAEYWCPWCGYPSGMLGAGKSVPPTPELKQRALEDEEVSKDYLRAVGTHAAIEVKFKDKWVKPGDLPQDEQDQQAAAIAAWKYRGAP